MLSDKTISRVCIPVEMSYIILKDTKFKPGAIVLPLAVDSYETRSSRQILYVHQSKIIAVTEYVDNPVNVSEEKKDHAILLSTHHESVGISPWQMFDPRKHRTNEHT